MKKFTLLYAFIFASQLLMAQVIDIPNDYPTIQEGIDAATTGQTVLVNPGTYVENINFNGKNITVASLYHTTLDTAYISQTVIDGNADGSVVSISSGEAETALLSGFTIINGNADGGGGIFILESSPSLDHLTIKNNAANMGGGIYLGISNSNLSQIILTNNSGDGGGIACQESNAVFSDLTVSNNTAPHYGGGLYCDESSVSFYNSTFEDNDGSSFGGAIFCWDTSNISLENVIIKYNIAKQGGGMSIHDSYPNMKNVTIAHNTATKIGGGLNCDNSAPVFDNSDLCNIYLNTALEGNDIFSDQFIEIELDTFSVISPTDFYASPLGNYSFTIANGKIEQTAANLFVSPTGDDLNSGTSPDEALQTIHHATSIILADSTQERVISLLEGTFSPQTNGESFPINIPDYISLKGESPNLVILDADSSAGVVEVLFNKSSHISGLTIEGGNTLKGAGIYGELTGGLNLELSKFVLENIIIQNCHANYGAAIFFDECSAKLKNVLIAGNSASVNGGGMYFTYSNGMIINTTIADNTAGQMAGALHNYRSMIFVINTIMRDDTPQEITFVTSGGTGNYGLVVLNSDVQGGEENIENPGDDFVSWAESNIDEDPVFLGKWDDPYQINDGSPCIDTGTPDTTELNLPDIDLGGDLRVFNDRIDIGAYEWNLYVGVDETIEAGHTTANVFPNPFNSQITISMESKHDTFVQIEMYDVSGTMVRSLGMKPAKQGFSFSTNDLKPGIYFVKLQMGGEVLTKKVVKL